MQAWVGDVVRGGEKEENEGYDVRDTGITKCHGRESGDKYGKLKVRMHVVVCVVKGR